MAQFKIDTIERYLRDLHRLSPDVVGSVILSFDGFPIASRLMDDSIADEERLAAKSAAILGLAERVVSELALGHFNMLLLGSSNGPILVRAINRRSVLVVICRPEARTAMVTLDIEYCIPYFARLL